MAKTKKETSADKLETARLLRLEMFEEQHFQPMIEQMAAIACCTPSTIVSLMHYATQAGRVFSHFQGQTVSEVAEYIHKHHKLSKDGLRWYTQTLFQNCPVYGV